MDSEEDDEEIIKGLPRGEMVKLVENGSPIDEDEMYEDEYHLAQVVADKRKRLEHYEDDDILDEEEDEEFRQALEQAKANAEKLAVNKKK